MSFTPSTRHEEKTARIAAELRRREAEPRPLSLKKRSVSHLVPKRHDVRRADEKIDISDLDEVLFIDPNERVCVAEPGVTFVDLVERTLRYGLVPIVVPELETITVGGAVTGASVESMSFRYGGFHDGCTEYEILTSSGELLTCTPDNEHKLVFEMMHGSFGTLGILTKLTFGLVPAKPYVRVVYERYTTFDDYTAAIGRHARSDAVDFIDGIMHHPQLYVLSIGYFVDDAPYTHRYDWVTVYYRTTARRSEDYFRTKDYFFRYDRGVTNPTPKSFLARLFFGKFLDSTKVLRLAELGHRLLSGDQPNVTLDVFVPVSKARDFMSWYGGAIGYFPLWCVPYRVSRPYAWVADGYLDGNDGELYLDIAIYGLAQQPGRNYYKDIERELAAIHGIKTLISHNYYDEETFWTIWNKPHYGRVKSRTDPRNRFRDLWEKTSSVTRSPA